MVGKCSLGTAGAGSVVPRPAGRPGPSSSQALGHPGTSGSLRRSESRVGVPPPQKLIWPRAGGKGEKELCLDLGL